MVAQGMARKGLSRSGREDGRTSRCPPWRWHHTARSGSTLTDSGRDRRRKPCGVWEFACNFGCEVAVSHVCRRREGAYMRGGGRCRPRGNGLRHCVGDDANLWCWNEAPRTLQPTRPTGFGDWKRLASLCIAVVNNADVGLAMSGRGLGEGQRREERTGAGGGGAAVGRRGDVGRARVHGLGERRRRGGRDVGHGDVVVGIIAREGDELELLGLLLARGGAPYLAPASRDTLEDVAHSVGDVVLAGVDLALAHGCRGGCGEGVM